MIATYVVVGLLFSVVVGAGGGADTPEADPTATAVAAPSPTAVSTYTPSDEPTASEPTKYKKITRRRWKKIAKDPDSHIGEAIVVYGQVTQFDAATGTDTFRGDVGGVRDSCDYGLCMYPTNTVLNGDEGKLSKLVQDDVFRAKVEVAGSLDYDTQIGGSTTVPLLLVHKVKVLS